MKPSGVRQDRAEWPDGCLGCLGIVYAIALIPHFWKLFWEYLGKANGLSFLGESSKAEARTGSLLERRHSFFYLAGDSIFDDYKEALRKKYDWEDVAPLFRTARLVSVGTMPMSLRCTEATLFRLHQPAHFHHGKDFWKTFENGPWKWSARQRYSGGNINPGHFFTLFGPSAVVELGHYTSDLEGYGMLKIQGPLDNIFDLTDWRNIMVACQAMGVSGPATEIILDLVNVETGGNELTDAIGYYAYRRGYAGVVFFSARTMDAGQRSSLASMSDVLAEAYYLDMMKADMHRLCVVLFSGSQMVRRIKRYSFAGENWINNPYFGAAAEELDGLTQYNESYQASMFRMRFRGDFVPKIVPWSPSETET
jgi:hypothetical protein